MWLARGLNISAFHHQNKPPRATNTPAARDQSLPIVLPKFNRAFNVYLYNTHKSIYPDTRSPTYGRQTSADTDQPSC